MPKLNGYIEVGFCAGYGDGDYRVSGSVAKLSRKEMEELIVATFHAQRCAWDMWCRGQAEDLGKAEKPSLNVVSLIPSQDTPS